MKTRIHFWSYLAQFFLEWKIFETHALYCTENQNTRVVFSNFFFRKAFCLWDNVKNFVQPDRPQMTIWRTQIAGWIPKATNTHSEYVILIAVPLQQWLHERTSTIRYTHIASLVKIKLNICYCTPVCESLILCNYTFYSNIIRSERGRQFYFEREPSISKAGAAEWKGYATHSEGRISFTVTSLTNSWTYWC